MNKVGRKTKSSDQKNSSYLQPLRPHPDHYQNVDNDSARPSVKTRFPKATNWQRINNLGMQYAHNTGPVVVFNAAGKVIGYDRTFMDRLSLSTGELLTTNLNSFPEWLEKNGFEIKRLDSGRLEYRKDSIKGLLQVNPTIYSTDGGENHLTFINDGIADSIVAEKEAEAESCLRSFLENQDGAAFIKDLQGRYLHANQAFYDSFGIDPGTVGGDSMERIWGDEIDPDLARQERESLRLNMPVEMVIIKDDGRQKGYWQRTVFPIGNAGTREYLGGIYKNITDQVRMEKLLHSQRKALKEYSEKANQLQITLDVVLKRQEKFLTEYRDGLSTNIKKLVVPYLEMVGKVNLDENQISNLESARANLDRLFGSKVSNLGFLLKRLTPRELEVALLVKEGKSTLEISEVLYISDSAVSVHRKNIRQKLGLKAKKINLRDHLQKLEEKAND